MPQMEIAEVIQMIAWITALVEFIMGLYIFMLNYRHSINRHVSILLLLISINTYAQGQIITAENLGEIERPILLLAATTPAIQPGLLLVATLLLKPQWFQKYSKINRWLLYIFVALPLILTVIDFIFHTNIWYSGYQGNLLPGGFISLQLFTQGSMGAFLRILYTYGIGLILIFPLTYIALIDKSISRLTRKLAFILLAPQLIFIFINYLEFIPTGSFLGVLITNTILACGYTYATFLQLFYERRLLSGRLEIRITTLILAIIIPIFATILIFIITEIREIYQITTNFPVEESGVSQNGFMFFPIIVLGIGVLLIALLTAITTRLAIQPIKTLTQTAEAISEGDLSRVAPVESDDEIGILARSFNQMTEQLLELIGNLEKRVSENSIDLDRLSAQLQATTDVGRATSSIMEINLLLDEIVGVLKDRLNLYYVGLFMLDDKKEWAYLQAGTGRVGKEMISRGYRIRVGQGMIGWAIANSQTRVAGEVQDDIIRVATTELPDTRSEAAIPMKVRGEVIGAINLQDSHPDRFDELTIATIQTIADLVSMAIDNAVLYKESREASEVSRRAYGEISKKSWQDQGLKTLAFRSSVYETHPIQKDKNIVNQPALELPIKVRDTTIGKIIARKPQGAGDWLPDEISILNAVVEQLGVALESASLYEETQKRAIFEQLTREVTTQMRQSLDIDTVIRIAAAEFKRVFDLSEVEIRMGITKENIHT